MSQGQNYPGQKNAQPDQSSQEGNNKGDQRTMSREEREREEEKKRHNMQGSPKDGR